jgi:hypothetical protein
LFIFAQMLVARDFWDEADVEAAQMPVNWQDKSLKFPYTKVRFIHTLMLAACVFGRLHRGSSWPAVLLASIVAMA